MPVELVSVGHVLRETIVFADGRRKGPLLGSPAAYSSCVAARLGVATGLVTKLESAARDLLRPLSDAGVDLSGVDFQSPVTTTNELVYASDGTKELKYLKQAAPIAFADIPADYRSASAFHVCPLDYEIPPETVRSLRRPDNILCVDLGGYGGAHVRRDTREQKKLSPSALAELVGCFTVVKASDEDVRLLFENEPLAPEAAARRFVEWGAEVGIVTMGPQGSLVASKGELHRVLALEAEVLDVTGAGDCYIAAFLVEFLRARDPWASARFAAAVAKHVIERTGGVLPERMPTERETRALAQVHGHTAC